MGEDRAGMGPLGTAIDIFQIREYFNAVLRMQDARRVGVRGDARFVAALVGSIVRPAGGQVASPDLWPPLHARPASDRRVALVATGGSGAMASVVGAARAFEELGLRPSVISVASGAALFGLPVAAGKSAAEVATFTLSLRTGDYVDWGWRRIAGSLARGGRDFGGFLSGERLEQAYLRFLGDRTLADLPLPAYVPVWNVEENRVDYLGPRTHPHLRVARAVRMAVALPLLMEPVSFEGGSWCDGGVVDILPVRPALELEPPSQAALVVNCFYPPGFAGEGAHGWREQPLALLGIAGQARSAQHLELARQNLERLRGAAPTAEIQPVSYTNVRGVGLYTQFLDKSEWPAFMEAGRGQALPALRRLLKAIGSAGPQDQRSVRASASRRRS